MFQDDPINLALRTLVRTALGLPQGYVRAANQTGAPADYMPSPAQVKEPYATVLIVDAQSIGHDQVIERNDPMVPLNLLQLQSGMYHAIGSVQFFRDNAVSLGRRLRGALETSDSIALMQSQNLGLISVGNVRNLTGVIDTFFEERAQVNVEFYITVDTSRSVPTFGTFPISVTLGGVTTDFEVSEP